MIIISVVMTVIILMQEGKNQGLGALAGSSNDTYWGKNRGRSTGDPAQHEPVLRKLNA